MKLFLQILLWSALVVGLLVAGIWVWAAQAKRPGPAAPPLAPLSAQDFQNVIDGIRAERRLVGLVGRVDVGGETVAVAASGFRQKDGEAPIEADDLFHVGSIGKSMSATVIATLVEEGVLSWDSTLGETLPDLTIDEGWKDITLWQLVTHTSGVPRPGIKHMLSEARPGGDETFPDALTLERRTLAEDLLAEPPNREPGSAFAYRNTGYTFAALMASTATQTPWEKLVQTRLAEPLGLETLGFLAPTGDNPWGHKLLLGYKMAFSSEDGGDNPSWMAPAGGMHIGLDDLMDYGRAHLDEGRSDDAYLDPQTYQRLHTPKLNNYAAGWVVQTRDFGDGDEPVLWHNGSNTMWYALLVLLPDRDAVIALATNDGSNLEATQRRMDELVNEIGTALLARQSE